MRDFIALGSVPAEEECAQINIDPDFIKKTNAECKAYRGLLERTFGEPPGAAYFSTKAFSHDFGSYYEVCIIFDNDNEVDSEFAYKCEDNSPLYWDEIALKELSDAGFPRTSNKPVEVS